MVDYSKWKDIEISDDEDETHPNIDTPSLFRWRHEARVARMEELKKEKATLANKKNASLVRVRECTERFKEKEFNGGDVTVLKKQLEEAKAEHQKVLQEEKDLEEKERTMPWNIDTISQPGFTKTVVNNPKPYVEKDVSDEEKERQFKKFVKENEKLLKQFGMLKKYNDSKSFLLEHPQLVCDDTANYLVVWCINLVLEKKNNLMEHVAHQTICMQYIIELAKQLQLNPVSCVSIFYTRIQETDSEYQMAFYHEIESFKQRVEKRANEKLEAALKEQEEQERKERVGPGGLDPVEVFESLPGCLKQCFESKDIPMLQRVTRAMDPDEATYHMKRCVDSGLWIPGDQSNLGEEAYDPEDDDGENIYESPSDGTCPDLHPRLRKRKKQGAFGKEEDKPET